MNDEALVLPYVFNGSASRSGNKSKILARALKGNDHSTCLLGETFTLLEAMRDSPTTHPLLLLRLTDHEDRQAWEEFVRLYSPVLQRTASARGLRGLDIDELVQEVLLVVMKRIGDFEPTGQSGAFRRWLVVVAKNAAINKLTRVPRDVAQRDGSALLAQIARTCDDPGVVAETVEREWRSEMFVIACQSVQPLVQPTTWAAFWKTAVEGKDAAHVAKELGINIGAVYVARSRTMARLRAWVQNQSGIWEST